MSLTILHNTTDNRLLEEIAGGSMAAYKQLFVTYYSPLCEYATRYVATHEAEDLVQELMLTLWEGRAFLTINTSIKAYLFAATRNRCLNAIQKGIYIRQKQNLLYEACCDTFDDPDFYLANELSELIEHAIEELPESYRTVFRQSRFTCKTNADIARELGVSVKTVEYRIAQSLKILRQKLGDYLVVLLMFG